MVKFIIIHFGAAQRRPNEAIVMQKKSFVRQNIFPVITALIWGTAFVAQSVSAERMEPFTFNALRSAVAFVALMVISRVFSKREKPSGTRRDLVVGGIACGVLLFAASYLQQLGIGHTTAGKAGFITTLYVVLVPVFGAVLGRRAPLRVWISAVISALGLYFLCMSGSLTIERGDLYVMLCAIVFAFHILCIDRFAPKTDGIMLSCVQFLTMAVLSGVCAMVFESPDGGAIAQCALPILYVGIFSSGVGYTLQILAQRGSDPTVVTILLSLESVFSVLAGAVILGDRLTGREYFGCVLMFAAVILAQLPEKGTRKR